MNCPYCNTLMQDGYIKSSHRMRWGKEKSLVASDTDMILSNSPWKEFFIGTSFAASYCPVCKKIILSVE